MNNLEALATMIQTLVGQYANRFKQAATRMIAFTALTWAPIVGAFEFDTSSPLHVRWDNTLKYSAAWRVKEASGRLIADRNTDDGNRNFDRGLISNRVDLLSEFDVTYRNIGARISGAAWYDDVYHHSNDHHSPATSNSFSVNHNHFTRATQKLHGQQAEFLDAFAFANGHIGTVPANVRAGRHTVLWGESLLLAANGISYAQAPLDFIKAASVPGSQSKELFMPVGQISGQLQPTTDLSIAAYYQYEWRKSRIAAAGSYFSTTDVLDDGGESLLLADRPGAALSRGHDLNPRQHGQWGISGRYFATGLDTEFGLYYLNFHEKLPQAYLRLTQGDYFAVYPEDISVFGTSFSTNVGDTNIAGEIHIRHNTPLTSSSLFVPAGTTADNRDQPLYAVGDTLHAQLSAIYALPHTALWDGGSLSFEIGGVRRTHVSKNAARLDLTKDRSAWGYSLIFSPTYWQVLPGLDIDVPLSVTYNPRGKSPTVAFTGHRSGTFSLGARASYLKKWIANIQGTHYFGDQAFHTLADRDFISLSIQRTF